MDLWPYVARPGRQCQAERGAGRDPARVVDLLVKSVERIDHGSSPSQPVCALLRSIPRLFGGARRAVQLRSECTRAPLTTSMYQSMSMLKSGSHYYMQGRITIDNVRYHHSVVVQVQLNAKL